MSRDIKKLKPTGPYKSGDFAKYNPLKYSGKLPIIYRSSYELIFMRQLEFNPNVESWDSENITIPYTMKEIFKGKIILKRRNYHMDFQVVMRNGLKYLCEVKPMAYVPLNEAQIKNSPEHRKNAHKWKAAIAWCKMNGHIFKIITEKQLKIPLT